MRKCQTHIDGWMRTAAEPTATTTSAASGGSSEELLGPRPAIRKQGAADAGCRNPSACGGSREARLGQRSDFSRPRQGDAEKVNGVWEQRLRIHYNCVGTIEIPSALPLPTPDVSVNTRKGVVVNYAPCDVAI